MSSCENGDNLVEIVGTVEQIIYKNAENGYTVIDLFDDSGDMMTAVGIMPYVNEGDTVMLSGRWTNHQTFGRQFSVEYFDRSLPSEQNDILRYLASGAVKGIGPKTAEKIVGRYGGESFDIIENHPDWLADIPGISPKKAVEISQNFKEQFGVRNIMLIGQGELSAAQSMRIFKQYKNRAVDIIKENPYMLCEDITGIGFAKCDSLAQKLGISRDSIYRLKSGILYVLNSGADRSGHTYLPEKTVLEMACGLLGANAERIEAALCSLAEDKKIVKTEIEREMCIYLSKYYKAERYSAEKLALLDRVSTGFSGYDKRLLIDRAEIESSITYASLQRKAIEDAIDHGVMILTGGPGTGKTTVIRAVIRIFDNLGQKISLAAPTGRAAKRMSDSTGCEAKTIHRLLEMDYENADGLVFRRNENDPLDSNVIIIDEASMLGISLFEALLKAIKPGSKLILIGDSNQLPSVGAGNVLADIIESNRFCTVCLCEIFRQAKESLIVTNAHAINNGQFPILTARDRDFFFLERRSDALTSQTVVDLCVKRLPKTYGVTLTEGIQVISPTRNGSAGTENLNRILQENLNPPRKDKNEKKAHGAVFREGDKVMQTRNNYDIEWEKDGTSGKGVFNGDIGVIESINTVEETLIINFDSRIAVYDFSMLEELEHSYAITVHKSQGSEYPIVILALCRAAPMLLTRNLLYTAVTRAQKMVIIVGSPDTVSEMVNNNRQIQRYTGLSHIMEEVIDRR